MNDIPLFEGMPVVDERSAPRDSLPGDSLIESVTRIFSDITRYPTEIIEPHADLETDLGIDSVKFGEIFAALRERYSLPPQDVMKTLPPERFRTVASIADLIAELGGVVPEAAKPVTKTPAGHVVEMPAAPTPPEPRAPETPAAATIAPAMAATPPQVAADTSSLLAGVAQIFADMTRYPAEMLDADADFENDLGIDSVKLGEIFVVLREKYHLPPPDILRETWKPEAIRSIRGIVEGISSLQVATARPIAGAQKAPNPVVAAAASALSGKVCGKVPRISRRGRGRR